MLTQAQGRENRQGGGLEIQGYRLKELWARGAIFLLLALALLGGDATADVKAEGFVVFMLPWAWLVGKEVRARRLGFAVRIDTAGVTVPRKPAVAWRELDRVEVHRRGRAVVFVPRDPAAELPFPPIGLWDGRGRQRRWARRYGSTLVIPTRTYRTSVAEVLEAVRRYSPGLPVFDGD
jgi:hypothetical protein